MMDTSDQCAVLLVEDEPLLASMMEIYIDDLGYQYVATVDNAASAVKIAQEQAIDLVIMDININGSVDGIELYALISDIQKVQIIYVTSNFDDDTFTRAMSTGPTAFITKPFSEIQFKRSVQLVVARLSENEESSLTSSADQDQYLYIKKKLKLQKVSLDDITDVEADGRYCRIYTDQDLFYIRSTLKDIETKLPTHTFWQSHRKHIVNIKKIQSINLRAESIILEERTVPISRSNMQKFKALYDRL